MGEGLARVITIGSIVLTVASLTLAVVFARKRTRIRVGFDVARAVIGVGAILAMAMITNVVTPVMAVLVAIAVGVGLGFTQGTSLEITTGERGLYAKRTPIALVGWGAGIILMQAAGIGSRTGAVQLGQTVAWFSACMGIGLFVGRTGPLNRSLARAGTTAVIIALALPATALVTGTTTPAEAQSIQLTDDEICDLTADNRYAPSSGIPNGLFFSGSEEPLETAIAGCTSNGWLDYTGRSVDFAVYLFASEDEALSQWQREIVMGDDWYAELTKDDATDGSWDPTWSHNKGSLDEFGLVGAWWSVLGVDDRVVAIVGPFMLYGFAYNIGFDFGEKDADGIRRPTTLIETMITPMVETVHNIEAFLAESSPPSDVASPDSPPATTVAPAPPVDTSGTSDAGGTALPPPSSGSAGPVTPEEAAGQAIAGVIAAAAIGLITWGEATGEITRILSGLGGSGNGVPPKPPEPPETPGPYFDPYDQTPLEVDTTTGVVWWPWDGAGGHWVAASEMPALLDAWNKELDAETKTRLTRHSTQADKDWEDLKRRTQEDARAERERLDAERERRRKEQRVADRIRDIAEEADFDQMVDWLDKNPSPTSEQLDALRAALGRQIGAKQAIDDLPDTGELVREAIRRTMGADTEWDKDHVTWADVADLLGQRGLGTALRNPEMTARVGAAMATGGWSEAAGIPLIDVPRALEQANAAREAAGLPDLTDDEARFVANNTIIKAIIIDQALERGIPLAGRMLGGGNRAAREAAQEALDASMRRSGSAASDAMGTTAVRSLPGDEALGRSLDEGLPRSDTAAPDGGIQLPPRREGSVPSPYGDQPVVESGPAVPGRQAPSGHVPPQPPLGSVDDLVRDAGAHQESLGGPGVQPRASATPPRLDPETGPFDGHPTTPTPEIPPQIDDGGFEVGTPPAAGPPGFGPEFGPRTTINPDVEIQPNLVDIDKLPTPSSSVGEIEGIKAVDDAMKPPTGSTHTAPTPMESPPSAPTPKTPAPTPGPEAPPSPPSAPETPPNQGAMEAVLRGETPPGVDDVQVVDGDLFVGTGHAGQGGWSPEALLREERFWHADGTPILGPEGVDVKPPPRGWVLQFNPRTRTATPEFGLDLTSTQKARLKRPGGPIDQLEQQINKMLDELGDKP